MALPKTTESLEPQLVLSIEEGRQIFEDAVQATLGISGDEFLARWDAGEYDDLPDTPEGWPVLRLSFLLPLARP
jgi:hypothetical protein